MKKIFTVICSVFLTAGAGYEGLLPDLEADMSYKIKSKAPKYSPVRVSDKVSKLQEIPREDKDYVDIIVKKNRTSEYVKDIQPIIALLEKFKTYVEDEKSVQMYNAIASNYIDHAYCIQKKYANRPEHFYASYRALMSLAEAAAKSAVVKAESSVYVNYLPYSQEGEKYTKGNIREIDKNILKQIYDTIYILKNLD